MKKKLLKFLVAVVAIIAGRTDTIPQPPPMLVKTGATVDRFVLWISATDPKWDAARAEGAGGLGLRRKV